MSNAHTNQIQAGDRVTIEAGDDSDSGRVHEINGDIATVGWDSGVTTPCEIDRLELED